MRCPKCGHCESKVVDSRSTEDNEAIRRRRECLQCGERFTTYERKEESPLQVVKKDNIREPFDRSKLMHGLVRATVKRNIPLETLDALINDIESELRNNFRNEVSSQELGDMILLRLRDLDLVAYVRFASVYKDFKDIDSFNRELRNLQ
ncbi:MAG: transcriptional regulator NrdR [Coriobacteriia bacterium]|nr:transcriptional regulator NrdR [Coriobacteriia bacterium]